MAEIWGVAIAAVASAGSAAMSARAADKGSKEQQKHDKETARMQIEEGRKDIEWQDNLADFRGQQSKQRRLQARANSFDKFSDEVPKRPALLELVKPVRPEFAPDPVKVDAGKKKKDGFFKKASGLRKLKKLF